MVLGPGGGLRFTDAGEGSERQPNLALSGTFTSDESAEVSVEATGTPCVGDEDLLIRAAGGVAAGSDEIGLDNNDLTWLDIEAVALENELVGVYRRTSGEVDDACFPGGPERVARAMFRTCSAGGPTPAAPSTGPGSSTVACRGRRSCRGSSPRTKPARTDRLDVGRVGV